VTPAADQALAQLLGRRLSRRQLLRGTGTGAAALSLAALAAGCGRQPSRSQAGAAAAGSLAALKQNAQQLSFLGAQSQLVVGRNLLTFGLSTPDNKLVTGGTPQVWLGTDDTAKAQGPYPAGWSELSAYELTKDNAPRSALTGFYSAAVDFPAPGNWIVVAAAQTPSGRGAGEGAIAVVAGHVPAQVGTKARSVATPVASSPAALRRICTRTPPDPMHYLSLDHALGNGKPTVVVFATPLLCTSRMCGPVVDEVTVAYEATGKQRANFIHVEIYPTRDATKPALPFRRWGFQTEPWTIVIDRHGIIRARFEGPVVAAQVRAALRPLLG
jgi:hypothetical protein